MVSILTDDEFEGFLDAISDGPATTPTEPAAQNNAAADDITDDEFENLLDELHGAGKGPGEQASKPAPAVKAPAEPPAQASASDEITDDEFEDLLDQLHGSGKGPNR